MKRKLFIQLATTVLTVAAIALAVYTTKCTFCNGTGWKGNYKCVFCKGSGGS